MAFHIRKGELPILAPNSESKTLCGVKRFRTVVSMDQYRELQSEKKVQNTACTRCVEIAK